MNNISEVLEGVHSVGIGGHVRPDGDCVGSCMALYLYLKKWYPKIHTDIYLEDPKEQFSYLEGFREIRKACTEPVIYDLFITCDVSSRDRIGVAGECFDTAKRTVCIDHHISNFGFAEVNHVVGDASSASEVLYALLDKDKVDQAIATAVYTGIIHDTGVFQYQNTNPETLFVAGELMKKGVPFSRIIDESFYQKTYIQNQVMGRVLAESIMLLDGKCIAGWIRYKDMEFYGVEGKDLDGIVSQLRLTEGVEAAIFFYENEPQCYKVSLRSNGVVDVSKVAVYFGGGGHIRAAGCNMNGSVYDVINNILEQIEKQL
ncbi:MAG: bifunctional oligoribonuclease/PAP phosphatase NrnA [Blautia sp.]|nr:bifunctional oligoribonuclease/PAP phosphatase NrnA [Blautia sp.]